MKIRTILYLFLLTFALFSCTSSKQKNDLLDKLVFGNVNEYTIPNKPSLRGVDILDAQIVWVSGSKGTYARSTDAGITWKVGNINNDTLLDFRDIHAFSAESAIAISAGSPARIYKTVDGGQTWNLKYENTDSLVFFDSFDFCDANRGLACSDPIRGNFLFIKTTNGGETWDTISYNLLPKPLSIEGGFAASGTSVICTANGTILFGTGGTEARIIRSNDYGNMWEAFKTPLMAGEPSNGIYSIGAIDEKSFIIAGGCWQKPDEAINNVAISTDSGKSWSLTKTFPSGFRSSIKYLPSSKSIVTCGTSGVDISMDIGKTWKKTPLHGYNAMDISNTDDFIVLVGSQGKIAFASLKILNE
ncbi:MAG: photosystem II stability/assembly factor-like protein [Bacteroidales bacterium]|nr:MAG: photosystem II stability/assembly factor-like protein [Bacteroidales bacterium]